MKLNLRVIQQYDPHAIKVIAIGTHVSAHAFVGNEWKNLNYEGPLLYYERNNCSFGFALMNRRAWKNLFGKISASQSIHLQGNRFLIYTEKKTGQVIGFYFHSDPNELSKIHYLWQDAITSLTNNSSSKRNV